MQVNLEFRIPVQEKTELVLFGPKNEKKSFVISLFPWPVGLSFLLCGMVG